MKHWWADTLFKRLFLLMWVALVASHLLAFTVTRWVNSPPDAGPRGTAPLPVLPSLPPMGARPSDMHGDRPPPPPPDGSRGGGLPSHALWLDYFIRFVAIGVAAWFGARWLSAPMHRLARASEGLGRSLGDKRQAVMLDEHSGTLEVKQTAHVFNAMAQRLRGQFDAQTLLMAAISHDLRTPLARLRMRLETMGEQTQTSRCVDDVREMDALIGGVLGMMRESHSPAEAVRVDLPSLAQSMVDDLAEQGQAARLSVQAQGAVVLAQPAALRRVLGNLIGNALRYGGTADVSVTADAREVTVLVDDRGPGIAPSQLAAVFEPFYRVEASRHRSTGGTGLGLYIARDLTERQGGRLSLANRAEGGLRVTLVLPRA